MELKRKIEVKKMKPETKICQTYQYPDLPYHTLPPSPHFRFPAFAPHTSTWSQPNDDPYIDEAEEYLNWQYDQEVKQFYIDAKQNAEDKRKVVNNNVEE